MHISRGRMTHLGRLCACFALLVLLAGCATQRAQHSSADGPVLAGLSSPGLFRKPERFRNIGARYEPEATAADWAKQLATIWLGGYPGTRRLPPDHVLPEAEAAEQFHRGRGARLALTWFGHSGFAIRSGSTTILTDPVFSRTIGHGVFSIHRIAPVRPRPAIIDDVDVILISHADYDHLDIGTLRRLARRFPDAVLIVPEGARGLVARLGFAQVHELGWYRSMSTAGIGVTAVPAIHGVRRLPHHPLDGSHWVGYRIEIGGTSLYFSGDTGAGSIFPEIRRRTGRADIALVPAGAWADRDFEKAYHVNPEEAVEIAAIMGAPLAIGMHWGTFALSEDTPTEQRSRFLGAANDRVRTTLFRIGETRVLR